MELRLLHATHHNGSKFMHIWIRLSGTGRQHQEPIFWLEILLETKLFYESLKGLIGFLAEVYRIWISGLESGRIQHYLNKLDRMRITVLFKFQDQDFQISFLEFDANTTIKWMFVKI